LDVTRAAFVTGMQVSAWIAAVIAVVVAVVALVGLRHHGPADPDAPALAVDPTDEPQVEPACC
ncbi:MAG: hypothetical protein ACRDV2_17585, partial [Actinomycetes bacterium]